MDAENREVDRSLFTMREEILEERKRFSAKEFPHLAEIVDRDIELMQTGQENGKFVDILSQTPIKLSYKLRLPVKDYPQISYVGRIVGQGGNTVKHLQSITGCKISVFGRGSVRDKAKEEEMRQQGGKYNHLNFDLHATVETIAPPLLGYKKIIHAMDLISALVSNEFVEGSDPISFLTLHSQSSGHCPAPQPPPSFGPPAIPFMMRRPPMMPNRGRGAMVPRQHAPQPIVNSPNQRGIARGGMKPLRGGPALRGGIAPHRGGVATSRGGGAATSWSTGTMPVSNASGPAGDVYNTGYDGNGYGEQQAYDDSYGQSYGYLQDPSSWSQESLPNDYGKMMSSRTPTGNFRVRPY